MPTSKLPTSTTPVSSIGPNPGAGAPLSIPCASSPTSLRMSHISGSDASTTLGGAGASGTACGTGSGTASVTVPGSVAAPLSAAGIAAGKAAGMSTMRVFTFAMSSPDSKGFVIKSLAPADLASSSSKASKVPARSRTGTKLVSASCLTALQSS